MITANADFVLFEGAKVSYIATSISVAFTYDPTPETFLCELRAATLSVNVTYLGSHFILLTKAVVDAKTGSGTETEACLDAVELAVIDYLDGITENAAVTFTN